MLSKVTQLLSRRAITSSYLISKSESLTTALSASSASMGQKVAALKDLIIRWEGGGIHVSKYKIL